MKLGYLSIIFYIILSVNSKTTLLRHQALNKVGKKQIMGKNFHLKKTKAQSIEYGDFVDIIFKGKWNSEKKMQNDFIDSSQGMIFLAFSYDFLEKQELYFFFEIYEGFYREENFLTSQVKFKIQNNNEKELALNQNEIKVRNFKDFDEIQDTRSCDLQMKIKFEDLEGQQVDISYENYFNIVIKGEIESERCNINFKFDSQYEKIDLCSVLGFLIINLLAIGLGTIPFYEMIRLNDFSKFKFIDDNVFLININIDFIHVSILTAFSLRVTVNYFEFLSIISIYLILSIILKMRAFISNFYTKMIEDNLDFNQQKKKRFQFMLKFLTFSLISVGFSFFLTVNYYWFLMIFCYPIIQIIYNSSNLTRKQCFSYSLYLYFFLPQLILPITLRGFTFDFLEIKADYIFVNYIIAIEFFLLSIMILQRILGPSFFLPKYLRPNFYEYERKSELLDSLESTCCPICFEELSVKVSNDQESQKNTKCDKFLQTPCGHSFHQDCLEKWMNEKFLCPCCRSKIPPYNQQNNQFSLIKVQIIFL